MNEQVLQPSVKTSYFKKAFFSFKINRALNHCHNIESFLLSKDYLTKLHSKINLITSDGFSNKIENSYFLYKRFNNDGSIKPIKKYTIINGEIVEHKSVINRDIIVLDLYEKSMYLHSYSKNNHYITGYLIKEKIKSRTNRTLIFSNEKILINMKTVNKYDTISVVDDFVNHYII